MLKGWRVLCDFSKFLMVCLRFVVVKVVKRREDHGKVMKVDKDEREIVG